MNIEITTKLRGTKLTAWRSLLSDSGLSTDEQVDRTVLIWDEDELIATGSRVENIFKYIAVKADRQGEDITAKLISALRADAFDDGYKHLFLYTKPENERIFSSLFFYPVAATNRILLMENKNNGIGDFLSSLNANKRDGIIGSVVMNCNPFTLGHQSLIERAAGECDYLYIFVLSEDKSLFSHDDRIAMVRSGTAHLSNVEVLPTGPYLISSATFPSYFIKDKENLGEIQCLLDIEIFTRYFAPTFSISRRYVGTEPLSPTTEQYNRALSAHLPAHGIELIEIERKTFNEVPISASLVREYIASGETDKLVDLLPQTTLDYLRNKELI